MCYYHKNNKKLKSKRCTYTNFRKVDANAPCNATCRYWLKNDLCTLDIANERGEMKEAEIAELLGISVSRVSQLLKQALTKMRTELGTDTFVESKKEAI